MEKRVKFAQQILKEKGLYDEAIDGIAGSKTMAALALVDGIDTDLPKTRQVTSFIQITANERGIDAGPVDGLWGPRTNAAFEELDYRLKHGMPSPEWRPDEIEIDNPNRWPVQRTAEFHEFYGERGTRQKMLDFPYPMRLSWDLRIPCSRTQCHEKVYDSLGRILQKVKEIYGENSIRELHLDQFGGCMDVRPIRGGSSWSMPSWGIALDFDHRRNALYWGRDRAAFAHPDYHDWWKCWEDEGWGSLSRKRNFDWMHVQVARLPE